MRLSKKNLFAIGGVLIVLLIVGGFFLLRDREEQEGDVAQLASATVSGTVVGADASFSVRTLSDEVSVAENGSFTMNGFDGGRHLAFVRDHSDQVTAFGFVTADESREIGPESTAVVLLFIASGGMFLPYESWSPVLDALERFAKTDALSATFEQISTEDPAYLTDENEQMRVAVEAAVDRLTAEPIVRAFFSIPTAQAKEFAIDSTPRSGIRVDRGDLSRDIFITNEYRRILRSLIYEIGYRKDGEDILYEIKDIQLEAMVDTPTIGKLTDVPATFIDYFLLGKTHYGEVKSETVSLKPDHTDADATYYRIMTLGWGLRWPITSDLTLEALTEKEQAAYEEIRTVTLVQEVILPIFMMALSTDKAAALLGEGGQTIATEIARLLLSDPRADNEGYKAIAEALDKGDLKAATKNTIEFVTKSEAFREIVGKVIMNYIAVRAESVVVDGLKLVGEIFARPLVFVNWMLKAFDGTVLAINYEISEQASEFTIAVRPPNVSLDPPTADLQAPANGFFKVVVQDATPSMQFEYVWSHENQDLGKFAGPATDPHRYTTENPLGIYQTTDGGTGSDTISVEVSQIQSNGDRVKLGTATATVTINEEDHCGKGTIELPPEYKLTYVMLDAEAKAIYFGAAGSAIHEAVEIVPPLATEFSLVTGASYTPDVEFYRDVVDHGTDYDFKTEPRECHPEIPWDCFDTIPVTVQRYFVTVPIDFSLDDELFARDEEMTSYGYSPTAYGSIYENNGDGTPTISYTCKVGRWDGSTPY